MKATYRNGPAGNLYDKYATGNPVARFLMGRFLSAVIGYVDRVKGETGSAFEVGCGEGRLAAMIAERLAVPFRACDCSEAIVEQAISEHRASGIEFFVRSVFDLGDGDAADLVIACEMLEHVEQPERALDALAAVTGKYCVLSVPDEPLWRVLNMARLHYLSSLGNTPGHVNHWSTKSFVRFAERRFHVLDVRTPIPWTVLLCEKKR